MWGNRKGDDVADLRERLEKLESRVSYLFRSLGIESGPHPPWQASPKVLDLVTQGKKVEAIKAFREESGASLKDAKIFVESLHDPGR